ncbi:MAG TPA: hypothetical protein VMW25_05835 [Clostridia bacterium]|nr:hypothetical protein [Clostridia bacterium]
MNKIFYDHLINIKEIVGELDNYELEVEEREELVAIIDETFHQHTLEIILTHLPSEYHQEFLDKFHQAPYDSQLLDFLREMMEIDIEEAIKGQAEKIKKEILKDIKKAKK